MMLSFLGFLFPLNIPGLAILAILDLPVGTDTHIQIQTHMYTPQKLSLVKG